MAGVGDGIGATGEVFEDGARIERFERQIAFDRIFVAITIDDGGSLELARDIDERAEGRCRLVDEDVITLARLNLTHGRPQDGREQLVLAAGFEFGVEEGSDQIVAGVVEKKKIFDARKRPRNGLRRGDLVATDLQYMRVVE